MNVKYLHLYPKEVQDEVRECLERYEAGDYVRTKCFDSVRHPSQRTKAYKIYWIYKEEIRRFFRMKYRALTKKMKKSKGKTYFCSHVQRKDHD